MINNLSFEDREINFLSIYHIRSQNESKGLPNQFHGNSRLGGEVEYYNDLPGKSPPDVSNNAKVTQQPITKDSGTTQNRGPGFRQRPFRGNEISSFDNLQMHFSYL